VVTCVSIEDAIDQGKFARLDSQSLIVVKGQAVWNPSTEPRTAGSFAFHAIDDPVDDGGPFELGEHPKQLHEHAARGAGGIDWLSGRTERYTSRLKFFEEMNEYLEGASEAVNPIDQQNVESAQPRVLQCSIQRGTVSLCSADLVLVGIDMQPARLARYKGSKAVLLGIQRKRLVLLVGGNA
jgi:hypothetical protein